nr:BglII/BstYI family type II restriction endonuclease [Ferrimicrobium acidiphilum]
MRVVAKFSFNGGREVIERQHPDLLSEVLEVIDTVQSHAHKTKASLEKTRKGKVLYSPTSLNKAFKKAFEGKGWDHHREVCEYPTGFYEPGYVPLRPKRQRRPYRDMDFVKKRLGVEVQFGKYSFMVYNVAAKMTIFHNLGIIDTGVEIVPVKSLQSQMSTGVSCFEQFVWDLQKRGRADIDIPVLILGVDADSTDRAGSTKDPPIDPPRNGQLPGPKR